jgi:hypothetical protein
MMGHLYEEALNHLPKVAIGVIFTNNNLDTITCEPCYLTNLKQIINRVPRELLKILYYMISWDVVEMPLVSGRESRILYYIDDATRIYYVYALIDIKQNTLI